MPIDKKKELVLYGSSYRTAPVVEREKMQEYLSQKLEKGDLPLTEAVLLTTCNRVELYAVTDSVSKLKSYLDKDSISSFSSNFTYFMNGQDVVRHLLMVSLGMDSLLPGEEGITHQIKSAMIKYLESKLARSALGSVFSSVIKASWTIRKLYGIKAEGEEIGNIIAVKVKEKMGIKFRITIVGSGRTAQEVFKSLKDSVSRAYVITKRNWLPNEFAGAKMVGYDSLSTVLRDSDAVISATNADIGNYPLTALNLPSNLKLLVDLSVPRSIDPGVKNLGFEIWDMDFIARLLHDYRFSYPEEINKVINKTAERVYYNVYFRRLEGSIQKIYKSAYKIAINESLNAQKLLKKGKYDENIVITRMAEKIVKKVLEPLVEIPKDPASTELKLSAIKAIYGDKSDDKAGN